MIGASEERGNHSLATCGGKRFEQVKKAASRFQKWQPDGTDFFEATKSLIDTEYECLLYNGYQPHKRHTSTLARFNNILPH